MKSRDLRRRGAVFFILAVISGLARVYAGLHFPLDMVGSLLVASLSIKLLIVLKKYLIPVNRILIGYFESIEKNSKRVIEDIITIS